MSITKWLEASRAMSTWDPDDRTGHGDTHVMVRVGDWARVLDALEAAEAWRAAEDAYRNTIPAEWLASHERRHKAREALRAALSRLGSEGA